MDNYSKAILTIIAVVLCAIAFKLYTLDSSILNTPTFGDFIALREVKDEAQRKEVRLKLIKSLPLVRVHGGHVGVD